MKLEGKLGHLSYCTNIHPGESWDEVFSQLKLHLPDLKQRLSPNAPFGIGLRLSAQAAQTLAAESALTEFKDWLEQEQLYVFTINGFPYGQFHGQTVKEAVYRPDWSEDERVNYSIQLAEILSELLPKGQLGTISTVPGAFKGGIVDAAYQRKIAHNLLAVVNQLDKIRRKTGKTICIALEPEPSCMLETVEETITFFQDELYSTTRMHQLAAMTGENELYCMELVRRHLGVCLDTCHAAVMFEEPAATAEKLLDAGITIAKIQLTAALSVESINDEAIESLSDFKDPIYLHQTCVKKTNPQNQCEIDFYLDLPEAISSYKKAISAYKKAIRSYKKDLNDDTNQGNVEKPKESWRSHYHVPVFIQSLATFETTSDSLARLLAKHKDMPLTSHLEVETYTFDVLPEQYRQTSVSDNIYRELSWVISQLQNPAANTD